MLGVDIIATSHTTSTFNMADVNVKQHASLMGTPTLKSNAGDQKVCKKKNPSWLFDADRKIVLWDHSAKPHDARQWSSDWIFLSAPHTHERFL